MPIVPSHIPLCKPPFSNFIKDIFFLSQTLETEIQGGKAKRELVTVTPRHPVHVQLPDLSFLKLGLTGQMIGKGMYIKTFTLTEKFSHTLPD